MKFGFVLPFGDARASGEAAFTAEQAGWDGFFLPEAIWHQDAWVSLTAAALRTQRIRLGTMLSALPRMRPWKLASQSATLDHLSGGRVILSLGLGALFMGYQAFPDEISDRHTRAELLDEGLAVLNILYSGRREDFNGKHYHLKLSAMDPQYYGPRPLQQPRIPLWVVGAWNQPKSMQRALGCDGILPEKPGGGEIGPEDVRAIRAYVSARREEPFDIVLNGQTVGMSPAERSEKFAALEEAGATWWIESPYGVPEEKVWERVREGPA